MGVEVFPGDINHLLGGDGSDFLNKSVIIVITQTEIYIDAHIISLI